MEEMTIRQLQEKMNSEAESARRMTEWYLARIEEIDKQGPAINAVLELNPDALAIADTLDTERKTHGPRGPLHGIPILIKDNIDTADQMMTTAGSLALIGSIASQDSFVAQKLREAGAVILGKTNLSEWANFRSTHSSSGWSSRGGQTRNPYVLDRNPFGSSAGSGVAVAANLCAAAIGTETDGSIMTPSSASCLVGVKPTVGLVGRSGIIPIAHSQDTAGPMARTVEDAAILLGALTGVDLRDSVTEESQGKSYTDYTPFLDPNGLEGARMGIARDLFGIHDKVDLITDEAIEKMKQLGAEIVDPIKMENIEPLKQAEIEVLLYEFKTDLNCYLRELGSEAHVHSLKEVIAFNEQNRANAMPYFGQDLLLKAEEKGPLSSEEYQNALEKCRRLSRTDGIDQVLQEHQLDAIVAPTGSPAWTTDLVNGDPSYNSKSSLFPAVAGYPGITVPTGFIFGLPVGISFFGGAYQEPTLIKLAYAYEQATQVRKAPQFLANADLSR